MLSKPILRGNNTTFKKCRRLLLKMQESFSKSENQLLETQSTSGKYRNHRQLWQLCSHYQPWQRSERNQSGFRFQSMYTRSFKLDKPLWNKNLPKYFLENDELHLAVFSLPIAWDKRSAFKKWWITHHHRSRCNYPFVLYRF